MNDLYTTISLSLYFNSINWDMQNENEKCLSSNTRVFCIIFSKHELNRQQG